MSQFTTFTRLSPTDNSMEWCDKVSGQPAFNIRPYGNVQYAVITLTAAQIKALHGTPVQLLAAPGAGKSIFILDSVLKLNFGTAAFAAGSTVQVLQNAIVIASTTAALVNNASSILIQPAFPNVNATASLGASNAAVTITASAAEFTTGDGTIDVHIWYSTIQD